MSEPLDQFFARLEHARQRGYLTGKAKAHGVAVVTLWKFEGWDRVSGKLLWQRDERNLIPTVGLNRILGVMFAGVAQSLTWYVGLIGGTGTPPPPVFAAADTMASHAGWTEVPGALITQTVRQTWTPGAVAGGSVDNSGAPVAYTIAPAASGVLQGGFLVDNNTLGGGTGNLYSEAAFAQGSQAVTAGQPISVTVTLTAVSA